MKMDHQHARWMNIGIGLALAFVYLATLFASDTMGFTRDESYYFHAGREYAGWFTELEQHIDSGTMEESFTKQNVDKHWSYNPEHPVLMKTLFGLSDKYLAQENDWVSPSLAMRLPTMLAGALLIFFTFLFALDAFGSRIAGIGAALSLALVPRLFFHAHLTAFDVGITSIWVITVYAYWRSLTSGSWVLTAGVLWGVALITKLNAFFIPIGLVIHWLLSSVGEWDKRRTGLVVPSIPGALISMAVIGPIIFYAGWPRHWFDTFERIQWYLQFHLHHEHYFVHFFGQHLWQPPFPLSYPFVMTLTTTPIILLVLWFGGIGTMLTDTAKRWTKQGRLFRDFRATGLLLAINALLPFLIIARPDTPIFGGVKHWLPGLPFLAIFGGYGLMRAYDLLQQAFSPTVSKLAIAAAIAIGATPAAIATWSSRDVGTGYYNELVGNFTGAADREGMRQFWGYAARLTLPWLNENLPKNATVNFHNTTRGAYNMYKEEGLLREDIRLVYDTWRSDCFVFHEQRAFAEAEYDAWSPYGTMAPVYVASFREVPMATVYCNSDTREAIQSSAEPSPTSTP